MYTVTASGNASAEVKIDEGIAEATASEIDGSDAANAEGAETAEWLGQKAEGAFAREELDPVIEILDDICDESGARSPYDVPYE